MKKFNIRKVLDGLKEVSSSTPSVQVGPQENHLIQETIQSEHFQLCKVREPDDFPTHLFPSRFALHVVPFPSASFRFVTVDAALIPFENTASASPHTIQ